MHYYEVGYSSYEEAPITTLTNDKEYTQEQFNELVSDCVVRVYKSRKIKYKHEANVDSLMKGAIKILEDEFGFKQPIIKAQFIPFGWASVKDDKDWEGHCDHDIQLKLIRKKING